MKEREVLEELVFLEAKESGRGSSRKGAGVLTIINASKTGCGTRIIFSKQLEEDLGLKDKIQIGITNDKKSLVVGENINESQPSYLLRRQKKGNESSRLILYNSSVIKEITEKMGLDFSEGISVTFYGIEYIEVNGEYVGRICQEAE